MSTNHPTLSSAGTKTGLRTRTAERSRSIRSNSQWLKDVVTSAPLFVADVAAVFLAWSLSLFLVWMAGGNTVAPGIGSLVSIAIAYPLVIFAQGLYPGLLVAPAEELRRVFVAACLAFLGFVVASFIYRDYSFFHFWIRIVNLALLILAGLLTRWGIRGFLRNSGWWKQRVTIIGSESDRQKVATWLFKNGQYGVYEPTTRRRSGNAILASPEYRAEVSILKFRKIWHVEFYGDKPYVTRVQENHLFSPIQMMLKRVFDLGVILIATPLMIPLFAILTLLVKTTSSGPVFYAQVRTGKFGKRFKAWKFRSMVTNSDEVLAKCLAESAEMREEWERDHKLKNDPRVTFIGRILRKTSLDELPQLFNVLKGEMSLVGPRPIVDKEIAKYANRYESYRSVAPGITGLWQVNGRNNTTYEDRTAFDEQYAGQWSVWFDLYILMRTIKTVLRCEGAY